jgi:hypothetical protein
MGEGCEGFRSEGGVSPIDQRLEMLTCNAELG